MDNRSGPPKAIVRKSVRRLFVRFGKSVELFPSFVGEGVEFHSPDDGHK